MKHIDDDFCDCRRCRAYGAAVDRIIDRVLPTRVDPCVLAEAALEITIAAFLEMPPSLRQRALDLMVETITEEVMGERSH